MISNLSGYFATILIAKAEALRSVTDLYRSASAFLEQDGLTDIVRRGMADFDALMPDEQSKFNAHVRPFFVQIEQVFATSTKLATLRPIRYELFSARGTIVW